MGVITLYNRSDTQTVNTITGYKEQESNSASLLTWQQAVGSDTAGLTFVSLNVTISKVASDGTSTELVTGASTTSGLSTDAQELDATLSFPLTSLVSSDCLKLVEKITWTAGNTTRTWVTNQLGWNVINAATWTYHRWLFLTEQPTGGGHFLILLNYSYGDGTYNSRIEGVDYTSSVIKSFNGVLYANLKKVNGVEIASVKKLMGVA
jgi:hypothetical protein